MQAYDLDDFDEVMTWLHSMHASVADTVEIVALTKTDLDDRGRPVLLVTGVALVSSAEEADAALAPFRTSPALDRALFVLDAVPTTIDEQRKRQLHDNPEGHRWAVDNAWLSGPASAVVPAMRRAYTTLPNDKAFTIWFSMAPLRALPDMAFSMQSEVYLASYVAWESPEDDERCVDWLASVMADLEPVTVGQYLGDSDLSRRQVRFMSDENFQRLQEIRAVRDPGGSVRRLPRRPRRRDQPQPLGVAAPLVEEGRCVRSRGPSRNPPSRLRCEGASPDATRTGLATAPASGFRTEGRHSTSDGSAQRPLRLVEQPLQHHPALDVELVRLDRCHGLGELAPRSWRRTPVLSLTVVLSKTTGPESVWTLHTSAPSASSAVMDSIA